jgi:hypothetical protein
VNVVATMLGGRWTYNAPPWDGRWRTGADNA